MGKVGAGQTSQWYQEKNHRDKVEKNYQALQGKLSLLQEWESRNDPDDHEYILELRAKVRSLQVRLSAMRP